MKRLGKIFLATVLLFVMSSAVLAQSANGSMNKTIHYRFEWSGWYLPVYCDGVQVDYLTGSVSVHWIDIITKNGVKYTSHGKGEAVSSETDETFDIHEIDHGNYSNGIGILHANLIGSKGTHYITKMTFNVWTGTLLTVEKAICPGN